MYFSCKTLMASTLSWALLSGIQETSADGGEAFVPGHGGGIRHGKGLPSCSYCEEVTTFYQFDDLISSAIDSESKKVDIKLCGWSGSITWPTDKSYEFPSSVDELELEISCCKRNGKSCVFDGGMDYRDDELIDFEGTMKHVVLKGLTFQNFDADDNLFKLDAGGKFILSNCVFKKNELDSDGIVDSEDQGVLVILDGNEFHHNKARAVYFRDGLVVLKNNLFYGHDYSGEGAVINTDCATVQAFDNRFIQNESDSDGGCFKLDDGKGIFKRNLFSKNKGDDGGVIRSSDGCLELWENIFEYNEARDDGGVIEHEDGAIVSHNNKYLKNTAEDEGGAIDSDDTRIESYNDIFEGNFADDNGDGGAIDADENWSICRGSKFIDNRADDDGGALDINEHVWDSEKCTYVGNSADDDGDDIRLIDSLFISCNDNFGKNGFPNSNSVDEDKDSITCPTCSSAY